MPENLYVTLNNWKNFHAPQGMDADTTDDAMIEQLLEDASRAVDDVCNRAFYPRVQTMYYNTPSGLNLLWLNDDLLAVTTLLNGDGSSIASTDYLLKDRNRTPYYGIQLKQPNQWLNDSGGYPDDAIALTGVWGYHPDYARAWSRGTLLNGAITDSATALTVDSISAFAAGDILRIESELLLLTATATNTLTVQRGHNGSTAAAHADDSPVYRWLPHAPIAQAVREIVSDAYLKRTGQAGAGAATITGAGVVIRPQGFPQSAVDRLQPFIRAAFA